MRPTLTVDFRNKFGLLKVLVYFDTVGIWVSRHLEQWEIDTLNSLCGCVLISTAVKESNWFMWRMGYRVRLLLEQPEAEAFIFLRQRFQDEPPPFINSVDLALDNLPSLHDGAIELHHFFEAHWFKPHHRNEHVVCIFKNETTYIGFDNRKCQYVIYSDKVSRHTGGPCCHLEIRFQSHGSVMALGIKSIEDLLNFNHQLFWKKRLRLYEYFFEPLGKRWNGRPLNHEPRIIRHGGLSRNVDFRTGAFISRINVKREGARMPILMDLVSAYRKRGLDISRLLVPLDVSDLIEMIETTTVKSPI